MNTPIRSSLPTSQPPHWRWMVQRLARLIACGAGSGLITPAPGTWGTLFGWLTGAWLLAQLGAFSFIGLTVLLFGVGIWACARCGVHLGSPDHGCMVIDEIVAFWMMLWVLPSAWTWQLLGFVLFRIFDIYKPRPIRAIDAWGKRPAATAWHSGFAVMADDVIAAFYALLVVALLMRWY